MGRMLDALKRTDTTRGRAEERPPAPPAGADAATEPDLPAAVAEEIPFIEVGPHRSMEASPSVLACAPVAVPPRPVVSAPSVRLDGPHTALPAPRGVHFRALPGGGTRSGFAPELVAYHAPEQPTARQYGEVLDAVLKGAASDGGATLLFTAALPRGGNTTALLNLAITAARRDRRRVVVVDANLRRPAVAERLGQSAGPGLREALAGAASLDEAVRATEQTNLFALTAGAADAGGVRLVAETMASLVRQLRQRWPLVFVDGPRWDGRPDVAALAAACDAVYLVVPESEVETPQTEALMQHIPRQGARLAGCVLVAGQTSTY